MGPAPPQPPPFYPPPPPYQGGPAAPSDTKAVVSLVLGILSILGVACFGGPFLGVPAIIFGLLAKRDVERAQGAAGGAGMAVAGIICGAFGTLVSLVWIALMVAGVTSSLYALRRAPSAMPPLTAPPSYTAAPGIPGLPTGPTTPTATTVHVVDLAPAAPQTLKDQLVTEQRAAATRGESLLVQTTSAGCAPCADVDASLGDHRMEVALSKVTLVRVDVSQYTTALQAMHMLEQGEPWFYKVDPRSMRAIDGISADEWDDNIPANMAPVLGAFVKGTYARRRHPSPLGTSL